MSIIRSGRALQKVLLTAVLLLWCGLGSAAAQAPGPWSPPQRIPDYNEIAFPPQLLVDEDRTVHAFNYQPLDDGEEAIFYRNWTPTQGWSTPVDILLSPLLGPPQLQSVFRDQNDRVHLIFFAGSEVSGELDYTTAALAEAGRAQSWARPKTIGERAGPLSDAALAGDGKGTLFVIYSGQLDVVGLYATYSTDGGENWSSPTAIAYSGGDKLWPAHLQLVVDRGGRAHATWTHVNQGGTGNEVLYSRFDPADGTWSQPYVLARVDGYSADWSSLVAYEDQLIVVYQNNNPATRWMRRSLDGGLTWSAPSRPFMFVGEYGFASFAVDSRNYLHMFLGNRTSGLEQIHGMWHSVWQSDHWSDLTPIISGPRVVARAGGTGFDPSRPRAIISQGNLALVTWWTDPGAGLNGAWYSYAQLDTPELPVRPLATPVPTPTPLPTSTPTILRATRAAAALSSIGGGGADFNRVPADTLRADPVLLAAGSVFVLIAGVVLVKRLRSSTRR